ncbi:MAG: Uma2 family endonuclease [Polyangiaceae bacterium]
MTESAGFATVSYTVRRDADAWVLPEVPVPESHEHDLLLEYLVALLKAWTARTSLDAVVARNLALRWSEPNPKVGIDPDVALITPAPPRTEPLTSLRLWKPGHVPPRLAIEVVSKAHPYKDYRDIHEKYAASGVEELWILDPERHGPSTMGGPVAIQQWVRRDGVLERTHFGDGPVFSDAIDAWLWADPVRISEDREATRPWLTQSETEHAEKEAERAEKEAALARVRELERELSALKERRG